jgi:hypothetical protein
MPSIPGGLQPSGHALCLRILEKNSTKGGCNAAGQLGIPFIRGRACKRTLFYALEMPDNPENDQQSGKPPGEPVEGTVDIRLAGKATARAQIRVRLIQHSPDADPELVEEVRKFERELKEKGSQNEDSNLEAPLVLLVDK